MARYQKILVAYDGSPSSRNALALACRVARKNHSWIKAVAVLPTYEGDLELIGVRNIQDTITGTGEALLAAAQKIAAAENVDVLTDLKQGKPYEEIVRVASDDSCDLIVMGRKGVNRLARELMGSVTARVIGHTEKNVLVVPQSAEMAKEHILVAVENSGYSEAALKLAIGLAKEYDAKLTMVSVVFTNDEVSALAPLMIDDLVAATQVKLDELKDHARKMGIAMETVVREGEPYRAITDLASEIGADLIVMGSHGRTGIRRLLMGSVTARTIGYAPCPVMVTHE